MKKVCILVTIVLLMLSACRHKEEYPFLNSRENIESIYVVKISFSETGEIIQTELSKIENIANFVDDFQKLNCYTLFGDPAGICDEGDETIAIKIVYKNDDYELITSSGQSRYTSEKGFKFYAGYVYFDKEEWSNLIKSYCDELDSSGN